MTDSIGSKGVTQKQKEAAYVCYCRCPTNQQFHPSHNGFSAQNTPPTWLSGACHYRVTSREHMHNAFMALCSCVQALSSAVQARPASISTALNHLDVLTSTVPEEMQAWLVLAVR